MVPIEVWGDGTAIRAYTYVSDMVDGIHKLMHSELEGPVNIGSSQYVSVDELVETVIGVSGEEIHKKYVEGPVGVQARNPSTALRQSSGQGSGHRFSKARIHSLDWEAKVSLKEGIARTYPSIEPQVKAVREAE